jgi:hypothetical protein
MFYCPHCGKEIRYIAGSPGTGRAGEPIVVETNEEYLIAESGRMLKGFREHLCPVNHGTHIRVAGETMYEGPTEFHEK